MLEAHCLLTGFGLKSMDIGMISQNKKIATLFYTIIFSLFSCDDDSSLCVDKLEKDVQTVCPTIYDPVCGCNGFTYSNECEAKKAGLKMWIPGSCTGPRKPS